MERHIQNEALDYLCRGFLTLNTPEECRHFLEDLCSQSELQEMSRRLQAAQMLKSGYIYSEIATQTGLSTATISRVIAFISAATGSMRCVSSLCRFESLMLSF